LGAKPVEVEIELANASTCQSYHLRIAGPSGLYLSEQTPIDFDNAVTKTAKGAPTPPHCRFRRRLGQAHAHFYSRYFPETAAEERPRIKFQYLEVPPGSMFRATATAFACLALVWLVGWLSKMANNPSDVPALLLAFPALAATWLGFDAPSKRLLEGTLSARFCLLATGILSISGSGLFMLQAARGQADPLPPLPLNISFLGVSNWPWAVLVAFALINFVHIAYKTFVATWRYAYLSTRRVA
jgi:hypothetical protein